MVSFHEANPTMTGEYLQAVAQASYSESFKKRKIKCKAIKRTLKKNPDGKIYCDTSHMFIKTFFDVVLNDFQQTEVIILRREMAAVLKSFIELGYFSPTNKVWSDWMIVPNAKTAAIACAGSYPDMDQYDRCIAYLVDIEARAQRFKRDYPNVPTYEVRLKDLNSYDFVLNFFNKLGIKATKETKSIIGFSINERNQKKKDINNFAELEYCQERIIRYRQKAESMGIRMPDSISMDKQ